MYSPIDSATNSAYHVISMKNRNPKGKNGKGTDRTVITVHVDRSLHRKLKMALAETGLTFQDLLADFLVEWVKDPLDAYRVEK